MNPNSIKSHKNSNVTLAPEQAKGLPQYFQITNNTPIKKGVIKKKKKKIISSTPNAYVSALSKYSKVTPNKLVHRHRSGSDSVLESNHRKKDTRVTFASDIVKKSINHRNDEGNNDDCCQIVVDDNNAVLNENQDESHTTRHHRRNKHSQLDYSTDPYLYWLNRISIQGRDLEYVPEKFRSDFRIVRIAVSNDWRSFEFISSMALKTNTEIISLALKQSFRVLQFVPYVASTTDLFLKAVHADWRALQYAPISLTSDTRVISHAISQSFKCLQYAPISLKQDRIFMLHAVNIDGRCMKYACDIVKDCKLIAIDAVLQRGSAIKYVSRRLQHDSEVLDAAFSDQYRDLDGEDLSLDELSIASTSDVSIGLSNLEFELSNSAPPLSSSSNTIIHDNETFRTVSKKQDPNTYQEAPSHNFQALSWPVKCINGHGLISFQAPWDGWCCGECGQYMAVVEANRKFLKGSKMYGCRQCDYDICESCFNYLSSTPMKKKFHETATHLLDNISISDQAMRTAPPPSSSHLTSAYPVSNIHKTNGVPWYKTSTMKTTDIRNRSLQSHSRSRSRSRSPISNSSRGYHGNSPSRSRSPTPTSPRGYHGTSPSRSRSPTPTSPRGYHGTSNSVISSKRSSSPTSSIRSVISSLASEDSFSYSSPLNLPNHRTRVRLSNNYHHHPEQEEEEEFISSNVYHGYSSSNRREDHSSILSPTTFNQYSRNSQNHVQKDTFIGLPQKKEEKLYIPNPNSNSNHLYPTTLFPSSSSSLKESKDQNYKIKNKLFLKDKQDKLQREELKHRRLKDAELATLYSSLTLSSSSLNKRKSNINSDINFLNINEQRNHHHHHKGKYSNPHSKFHFKSMISPTKKQTSSSSSSSSPSMDKIYHYSKNNLKKKEHKKKNSRSRSQEPPASYRFSNWIKNS